jgi:hypothetical protein
MHAWECSSLCPLATHIKKVKSANHVLLKVSPAGSYYMKNGICRLIKNVPMADAIRQSLKQRRKKYISRVTQRQTCSMHILSILNDYYASSKSKTLTEYHYYPQPFKPSIVTVTVFHINSGSILNPRYQ